MVIKKRQRVNGSPQTVIVRLSTPLVIGRHDQKIEEVLGHFQISTKMDDVQRNGLAIEEVGDPCVRL